MLIDWFRSFSGSMGEDSIIWEEDHAYSSGSLLFGAGSDPIWGESTCELCSRKNRQDWLKNR